MASTTSQQPRQVPKRRIVSTLITIDNAKRPRVDSAEPETSTSFGSESVQQKFQQAAASQPPTIHGTITKHLEQVLISNGKISSVRIINQTGPQNQRCCTLKALNDNKPVWETRVLTHIDYLVANLDWIVLASKGGEVFTYRTMGGQLQFSMRMDAQLYEPVLNQNACALHQTDNLITVWNFATKQQCRKYSLKPLLNRKDEKIEKLVLSQTGQPIAFMTSGDIWYFSLRTNNWTQIKPFIDVLTTLYTYFDFIKRVVPNGLISKIVIDKKQLKHGSVSSMLVAESEEEEQMEMLLNALEEMEYAEEYRLFASIYVSRLISRGKIRRLSGYLDSISRFPVESKIDKKALCDEIDDQLLQYPNIRDELDKLRLSSMSEQDTMEEDLEILGVNSP